MAYPQNSEELTARDVLRLPEAEQGRLIAGWIGGMGALLKAYGYDQQAACVWNWPLENEGRNKAVLAESFEAYADEQPVAVLLALLKRDCGDILPRART